MADTFVEKFTKCAKVCGILLLDCASWILIGWADKRRRITWIFMNITYENKTKVLANISCSANIKPIRFQRNVSVMFLGRGHPRADLPSVKSYCT